MNDIGLKSYQDIREPEYETDDRLPPDEWRLERDRCLEMIFSHVLTMQREMEVQLFYEWHPQVDAINIYTYNVDATWHSGDDNQIYLPIVSLDGVSPDDDPGEWAARVIDKLDRWADKFYEEHSV